MRSTYHPESRVCCNPFGRLSDPFQHRHEAVEILTRRSADRRLPPVSITSFRRLMLESSICICLRVSQTNWSIGSFDKNIQSKCFWHRFHSSIDSLWSVFLLSPKKRFQDSPFSSPRCGSRSREWRLAVCCRQSRLVGWSRFPGSDWESLRHIRAILEAVVKSHTVGHRLPAITQAIKRHF